MEPAEGAGQPALAAGVPAALLRVEVAYSPASRQVERVALQLPAGATLRDALLASGLPARHVLELATLRAGVWGRQQPLEHPLRDLDRVEIYRPLTVDPKEARRLRYAQHRERLAAAQARQAGRTRR